MRVAFFNWRDIRHPLAGGAEVFIHQILKRFVSKGHHATLFCSTFPGCAPSETIDGIEHVRYGGRFLMYPKAYACYRRHVKGKYDVIVESVNGMPLFLPFFAREKVVPFIHQLTRENWFSGLPLPLALPGYYLEDAMLKVYRNNPAVVPSLSTRRDLEGLGFTNVRIVHGGADIKRPDVGKEPVPTLLYLGRLTRSKRVDHALRAFKRVRDAIPAKLWVAGSGPEAGSLMRLSENLGLGNDVVFFGRVSEEKKAELLTKAHLMLFPAVREGWGLVVNEANACGTPVIGYDVPGLWDSITAGVNGMLVPNGDFTAMADAASSLLQDGKKLEHLSASSAKHAKAFTWDRSAYEFLAFLEEVVS